MEPVIFFRRITTSYEQPELDIIKKYFDVSESRVGLTNRLVIPRYSCWPHYSELSDDLTRQGSVLINTVAQRYFITNFNYYVHVKDFTPKTYFTLEDTPKDENMSFVVKGRTKSKKHSWNTKMFAKGYTAAANLAMELMDDEEIYRQGIIIREFVPLKVLEIGANGLPFANEWRFFYHGKTKLCNFFYWVISEKMGTIDQAGMDFADKISGILSEFLTFFVIDIAQKEDGSWILIEVNDGSTSGVSEECYDELYRNLKLACNP